MSGSRDQTALHLCGVDNLCEGRPHAERAIGNAKDHHCVLLVSHNPDFFEHLQDERVSFGLSGHTHGGQVRLPGFGCPVLPSAYGQKYAYGLVKSPIAPVYVSSGIGTANPPIRLFRPPEVWRC